MLLSPVRQGGSYRVMLFLRTMTSLAAGAVRPPFFFCFLEPAIFR